MGAALCKDQADMRPQTVKGVKYDKLNIIGFCLNPDSVALQLYCQASGLDFEYVEVNMIAGENKKPEFIEAHPSGHIPIMQDREQAVYGTSFIQMMHIYNRYQASGNKDRMNMKQNLAQLRKLFEMFDQRVRPVTQQIRKMLCAQRFAP